jgi:hypothetical protein
MAIEAYATNGSFTIISNACVRAGDLSLEALGLFTYLRSLPRDWRVMPTQLANHFKCTRDRIYRIIKELIGAGYVKHTRPRDPVTKKWKASDYTVFDRKLAPSPEIEPASRPESQPAASVEVSEVSESPCLSEPCPGFSTLLSTDLPSTDSTKEDNIRATADAVDASEVDRGERAGETSTNTEKTLRSSGRSLARFKQSEVESAIAWREFKRLDGWPPDWSSEEMNHWHRLLRNGHLADDIVDAAARYLSTAPAYGVPSREDFLAGFESYLAEDASLLPPMQRATATDRHHARA